MHLRDAVPALDALVSQAAQRLGVPGVALGVLLGDEEHAATFGVTNVDHPLPVTDRTMFQVGSTSKTLTATALMQFVERDRLDLGDPVQRYMPEFDLQREDWGHEVLVRHLLTHVGGWDGDHFLVHRLGPGQRLARLVGWMGQVPLLTRPGEVYAYNNAAFGIAGRLLEILAHGAFEDVIDQAVFGPLGMTHSTYRAEDTITERVAAGHRVRQGRAEVVRPWALEAAAAAHGGVISDLRDMLAYARFHLGDGAAASGARLLEAATMAEMQREQVSAGSNCHAIGISWLLRDYGGLRLLTHGGETNGHLSAFVLEPSRRFALVTLTNADAGASLNRTVTAWCVEHLLGGHHEPPPLVQPEGVEGYAGRYEGSLRDVVLTPAEGGLTLRVENRPRSDRPAPRNPDPVRLGFIGEDRVVDLDEPGAERRGEFLRNANHSIEWFRWDGRLMRPQGLR